MNCETLGICQWFHFEDYATVERAVDLLRELGIRHLRTGISWADYHRCGGRAWYEWQMRQLEEFDVLLSVWHTPPSLAENGKCNGPPRNLADYAGFIWQVNREYGEYFSHLELWNEPNNRYKWDFIQCDPRWEKFAAMIAQAARQSQRDGKPTVLGGMMPVDHHWLLGLREAGALDHIDVIAIHAFPDMWWDDAPNWEWYTHWNGWDEKIDYIASYADGRPIWVTETGLATWDLEHNRECRMELQSARLRQASQAPVERLYWYSLIDLAPEREAIEGFHVDENEYHMGLFRHQGPGKPACQELKRLFRTEVAARR